MLDQPAGVTVLDVMDAMCKILSTVIPGVYCNACDTWMPDRDFKEHKRDDRYRVLEADLEWDGKDDDKDSEDEAQGGIFAALGDGDYEAANRPFDIADNLGRTTDLYCSFSYKVTKKRRARAPHHCRVPGAHFTSSTRSRCLG